MATRGLPLWPHLDAEADALPAAESLVLEAMRAWAAGPAPLPAAALVLAAEGAEGLAMPLDALLRTAGVTPACRLCPRVALEEAVLLAALGLAQHGERSPALAVLGRIAAPLPAYRAMAALLPLAHGLRRLGLFFRHPFRRQ
ncbi:MAG: hypothetical protein RMK64_00595 [Rhodovarius sp.]|nr:hypothetical protein [Rhodovarius sp.]MCX7931164.1 hypothetical protein [Rhodovarius sp.]MDW8313441.1 hypothetical protein [Rhodovarius sp.]